MSELEKEVAPPSPGKPPGSPLDSKEAYRTKVWDELEQNRLVMFPWPAHGRIPNYKGAADAAAKLRDLSEFQSARSVAVNPDKSLETSRVQVVDSGKALYVPIPRLKEGLLKKLSFDEDRPKNVRQMVTRWGLETYGKAVDFGDELKIDLLILGSVAVSRGGHRIGKGKGYADLEYAILKEMKAVDENTVIVTTVHDSQVFESLPDGIFREFDVPLDYILTPTQIIKIEKKLARPEGIYWGLLSQRRVGLMPILQKIKDIHSSEGKATILKEVDSEVESEEKRKPHRLRRFTKRRRPQSEKKEPQEGGEGDKPRSRQRRFYRRSQSRQNPISKENQDPGNQMDGDKKRGRTPRRSGRQVDFSLVVSNIHKNVRVRNLKDALIEHGIKPNNITWRGYKGFCYLHYAKPAKKKLDSEEEKPFAVDNVIEILQSLKLSPESEGHLDVKVMETPITRIETTDVTAV